MEVKLTIPDDMVKFVEFIPNEVLPSVIIDIFRNGIKYRHEQGQPLKRDKKDDTLDEILSLLQCAQVHMSEPLALKASSPSANMPVSVEEKQQLDDSNAEDNEYQLDVEDDDLGDLMDLLK